jgi:hypothetical protein
MKRDMTRDPHKRSNPVNTLATVPRDRSVRCEIAYRAARLIAEDGLTDFAAAKQKAARQMGVSEKGVLPDNHEIEAALKTYQSLFQRDTQPQECRALREVALNVMGRLDRFSPWLVGSVLTGSANRFSQIELEIVAEDAKQLEMFFLNEGIPFETRVLRAPRVRAGDGIDDISVYELSVMEISVVISFYPKHAIRAARRPRGSLTHERAQLNDVALLLA